jgi:hypothetical protein
MENNKRLPLFDNLRGLVIFLLLTTVFMVQFDFMPGWIAHASQDANAMHLRDFGVVSFLIIFGFLFPYNFEGTMASKGKQAAVRGVWVRGLALMGIGFVELLAKSYESYFEDGTIEFSWQIFFTLGLIFIFVMPLLKFKAGLRFSLGFLPIIIHQALLTNSEKYLLVTRLQDQGGVAGLIPYIGVLLIVTAISDWYFKNKKLFYTGAGILIVIGAITAILHATAGSGGGVLEDYLFIYKNAVSFSYITISLMLAVGVLVIADSFKLIREREVPFLAWLGRSSIFFYVTGAVLNVVIGVFISDTGSVLQFIAGLTAIIAFLFGVSYIFHKRNIIIRI